MKLSISIAGDGRHCGGIAEYRGSTPGEQLESADRFIKEAQEYSDLKAWDVGKMFLLRVLRRIAEGTLDAGKVIMYVSSSAKAHKPDKYGYLPQDFPWNNLFGDEIAEFGAIAKAAFARRKADSA